MAFPQTVQDIKTELEISGTWTDITSRVRSDPGIEIRRGRQNENNNVDPTVCTLAVNNTDGLFSPRNPNSAYYGLIGRNTPIRVSILSDKSWFPLTANTGEAETIYATTPDAAALDLTGDVDLRFDADLDSWYDAMDLVSKWNTGAAQRSYAMNLSAGFLVVRNSNDGTAQNIFVSTEKLPLLYGRQAVRAVIDVNNGAAGKTATFYTSTSLSGTWTQLGQPVTTAGTTTTFSGSAVLRVGPNPDASIGITTTRGRIYGAEVRSVIGGTIVANPDFSAQADLATSFADSTGKTWTITGSAITTRDIRFRGEVSGWPQKWDQSGSDVYTEIEAAGITRRLGQGQSPVPSAMNRTISTTTGVVAYWPMEDGADSTSFGSALSNGRTMTINGSPDMATNSDFVASGPLPVLRQAAFTGNVSTYTGTNNAQARMYVSIPAIGIANGIVLLTVNCSGTGAVWNLKYTTGGGLTMDGYDQSGASILASAGTAFAINGRPFYVTVMLFDNGAATDVVVGVVYADNTSEFLVSATDTVAATQIGRVTKVVVNPQLRADDVVVGHLSVHSDTTFTTSTMGNTLKAWKDEFAGQRIKRICGENSIPFFQIASVDDTAAMGYQGTNTALELLRECAKADGGILYEPRDQYGLEYRTRKTLNNQVAVTTASYSSNQLMSFEPVEDDDASVNDVTVTRISGGSFRTTDTTSALSTQQPPLGVGVYDTEVSLSLASDSQLQDQAGFRLRMGTVNESRFPVIGFDTTSPSFLATSTLMFDLLQLDIGDLLTVTGMPSWMPPDNVNQIAQGFTEYLSNFRRTIIINCSPASPWTIGRYAFATSSGSNQFKYSSDGSTVNTSMNTTTTTMSVATASGPLWTTEAAQCPIDLMVGGERMTATAVSSTTSPQSFTVVRSVNGIVKSHSVGESVTLFRPARYGF